MDATQIQKLILKVLSSKDSRQGPFIASSLSSEIVFQIFPLQDIQSLENIWIVYKIIITATIVIQDCQLIQSICVLVIKCGWIGATTTVLYRAIIFSVSEEATECEFIFKHFF